MRRVVLALATFVLLGSLAFVVFFTASKYRVKDQSYFASLSDFVFMMGTGNAKALRLDPPELTDQRYERVMAHARRTAHNHVREAVFWSLERWGVTVEPRLVEEIDLWRSDDRVLAAATVLSRTSGPVVTNLSTSQVVEDVARAFGATLHRAPVGEVNVARRMQLEGAVVGGEGNGGVILPALHHTRDAPLAVALILQHLAEKGLTPSEAAGRWPAYEIVKEKVSFPRQALQEGYLALEGDLRAEAKDESDGLRLAWPTRKAWLHVRPSGTEPVVRLIAEAPDARQAKELVTRAAEVLAGVA